MKLLRYGEVGAEKPGMLDEQGDIRDLSTIVSDISPAIIEAGGLGGLKSVDPTSLPRVEGNPVSVHVSARSANSSVSVLITPIMRKKPVCQFQRNRLYS